METTRVSLLLRVKNPQDSRAWQEFFDIYAPLLYRYARARRLSRVDAVEVRDQCLAIVARKIGGFEYDRRKGTFKSWLRRIADSKVADLLRRRRPGLAGNDVLETAAARSPSPAEHWEQVWELEHIRYCVERVRCEVSEPSFQAFRLLLFEGLAVQEVCERLGLNPNQVYKAKSKVLGHVRKRLVDLGVEA